MAAALHWPSPRWHHLFRCALGRAVAVSVSGHLYSPLLLTDGQRTQGRLLVNLSGAVHRAARRCLARSGMTRAPAAASRADFPDHHSDAIVLFPLGTTCSSSMPRPMPRRHRIPPSRTARSDWSGARPFRFAAAPVLAALGYRNAAEALIFPMLESLALFAVLLAAPAL